MTLTSSPQTQYDLHPPQDSARLRTYIRDTEAHVDSPGCFEDKMLDVAALALATVESTPRGAGEAGGAL